MKKFYRDISSMVSRDAAMPDDKIADSTTISWGVGQQEHTARWVGIDAAPREKYK